MNFASAISPAVSAIAPALFTEPTAAAQAPSSHINFLTLLLAPPSEGEALAEDTVQTTAKLTQTVVAPLNVASPQQIAQAVIRSMLMPIVSGEAETVQSQVEQSAVTQITRRKSETKSAKETPRTEFASPDSSEAPEILSIVAVPVVVPSLVQVEQGEQPATAPTGTAPQPAASLPAISKNKPESDAPVAFALRLTPVLNQTSSYNQSARTSNELTPTNISEAPKAKIPTGTPEKGELFPEHFRVQRTEASTFDRNIDPQTPQIASPLPKTVAAVAEVQTPIPAHEASNGPSLPPPSLSQAMAAPLEAPKSEVPSAHVHEIAMRVSAPDSQPVDVRVSERGGEVHVAVRTADTGLQSALKGDLGFLVGKLEESGFRTETLIPIPRHSVDSNVALHPLTTQSTADLSGSGTYGESQDTRGESSGRWPGSDSPSSDHRQQQQQHRRPQRTWEEMMEDM